MSRRAYRKSLVEELFEKKLKYLWVEKGVGSSESKKNEVVRVGGQTPQNQNN